MTSPLDRLRDALDAWRLDGARERIARARGDADADSERAVAARHAALRGPRARELFEEARERGFLHGDALASVAGDLRDAYAAPGRARANERAHAALSERVPHDSDHHAPIALALRMAAEPHEGRRRAMARSLEAFAPRLAKALRDGRADVEESLEGAAWLRDALPADPKSPLDAAREVRGATEDAWAEARERVAHADGAGVETWADLAFVLRAPRFDAIVDPRRRWRRLADRLAALGVRDALSARARVEPVSSASPRVFASVVPLSVPRDQRILPATIELGLASERDAMVALGRALALAWTHPALPSHAARRGTVGRAVGALFAHLLADPRFAFSELSAGEARSLRELAVALELFALRTDAAVVIAREHRGASAFADAAREALRDAWQVDVGAAVAECVCLSDPSARLRAARWAPALHAVLRERYDEDFWRNPRAKDVLRAACERGGTISVESWAEELGADPASLAPRYAELLG